MRKTVNPKVQEATFNRILNLAENSYCADCQSRGPCWVSLDFGAFICFNCSGEHRHLGMHITRVRSCKIDNWTQDELNLMEAVGNERSNLYWEGNKKKSSYKKLSASASANERRMFMKEKYLKKSYVDSSVPNPVEVANKAIEAGKNPIEFVKKAMGQGAAETAETGGSAVKTGLSVPQSQTIKTNASNGSSANKTY